MYIAKFWLFFFLILNNIRTISQTEISHKFGKIKSNEISQNICPIDSNALAYYLFDEGSSFMLTGGSSWRMAYHRHYRIHILDRSVRKLGIVSIPLYIESPKAKEELIELKASTFNLINSKIVETKLEKNEIRVNKTSEQWSNADFIMPNVKSGSMIEIEYTIYSDFWNTVQPWEFQHDLPTLESEYTTAIPEDLRFKPHIWGNINIEQGLFNRQDSYNAFNTVVSQYYTTDIPAFPMVPYILNRKDHLSRIEFELVSTENDNGKKNYSLTWPEISKQLLTDENFGKQLFNNTFLLEVANNINANYSLTLDKIKAAYEFIHSRMKWNGEYGVYPSIDIQKSYDTRQGNVADINLLLIKLLNALEIPAAPVILSTVKHGRLLTDYASLSKVNYVIVAIPQEDKKLLMDAADPFASFDLIPPKCFNGPGLMLNAAGGAWIDIKPTKLGQVQVVYKLKLNTDNIWEGTYTEHDFQYSGYKLRDQIKDSTQWNAYLDFLHDQYNDIRLSHAEIIRLNESDKEVMITADIKSRMGFEYTKDSLTFSPIQMERILVNPFIQPSRTLPVEYEYPWMTNVSVEIIIPTGYKVNRIPSSATYQNAAKTIKFTFLISQPNDTMIVAKSLLIVNQSQFSPEEYPDLKAIFDHVVSKQSERVVFIRE